MKKVNMPFRCTAIILTLLFGLSKKIHAENYIVALDLSDRIMVPGQIKQDQDMVMVIFDKFENLVKKQLYINSKDSFKISIIPQKGGIDANRFGNSLYLNLDGMNIGQKRIEVQKFRQKLPSILAQIYKLATIGRVKKSNYAGADIWKYFNDYLPIEQGKNNNLFLVTDGYLDFESNNYVKKAGNRRTDSNMITHLRNDPDWSATLHKNTEGIIPTGKIYQNMKVNVLGIRPKTEHLNEQDIIIALWQKWLKEMKISKTALVPNAPVEIVKSKLIK